MALQTVQSREVGPFEGNDTLTFQLPKGRWDLSKSLFDFKGQLSLPNGGEVGSDIAVRWPSTISRTPTLPNTVLIDGIQLVSTTMGVLFDERGVHYRTCAVAPANLNRLQRIETSFANLTNPRFLSNGIQPPSSPLVQGDGYRTASYDVGTVRTPLMDITDFLASCESYDTSVMGDTYLTINLASRIKPRITCPEFRVDMRDITNNTGSPMNRNYLTRLNFNPGFKRGLQYRIFSKNDGGAQKSVDRRVTSVEYTQNGEIKINFDGHVTADPIADGTNVTDIQCRNHARPQNDADLPILTWRHGSLVLKPSASLMRPSIPYLTTQMEEFSVNQVMTDYTFRVPPNTVGFVGCFLERSIDLQSTGRFDSYRFFVNNRGIPKKVTQENTLRLDRLHKGLLACRELRAGGDGSDLFRMQYQPTPGPYNVDRLYTVRGRNDNITSLTCTTIAEPIPPIATESICNLEIEQRDPAPGGNIQNVSRVILFKYVRHWLTL